MMYSEFKKAVVLTLAVAFSWPAAISSEPVAGKNSYKLSDTTIIRLAGVEVNAGRNREFSRAGRIVEEVKADEVRKLPVESTDALLRLLPGVDIRQRGTGSTQADISIRGGSFDQVLVLVNGINVTDPQTGHHNLNLPVDLNDLQSVEVLQGAASRRYGSQAFSGAINFITGPGDKNNLKLALTTGAYDTHSQQLSYSTGKKIRNYTSAGHYSSDGHRINTDYNITNVYNRTLWKTKKSGTFDAQFSRQYKSFGANGFYGIAYPNQFEHTRTRLSSLNWDNQYDQLYLQASLYRRRHYDRFELYRDFQGAPGSYTTHNYHQTTVNGGELNARLTTPIGQFTAGIDLRNDAIYSTKLGAPLEGKLPRNTDERSRNIRYTHHAERSLTNASAGYTGSLGPLFLSAGLSLSHSRDYGLQHHYGADLSYFVTNELSAYVSANTASRLPTFTDLYYTAPNRKANPALQPETARNLEGGVAYGEKNLGIKAGFFIRNAHNSIDWIKYPENEYWQSENLTGIRTKGLFAGAEYLPGDGPFTRLSASYQLMMADKTADGFDSMYALDYLKHQFTARVQHRLLKNVDASWTALLRDRAGAYADYATGAPVDYKPYLLVSTRVSWNLKRTQFYADANNLLNTKFVDFGGLPMPGFHLSAGVKWQLRR
jgi:iron complex outermembrane receptor protein